MSSEGMSSGSASGSEENENTDSNKPLINASGDYLKKSDILAAIQYAQFENLPAPVKKRVNALKNLQLEVTNLEAKFYEEVHLLECKCNRLYFPIHEKRQLIVTGQYEPTAEESEWKLDLTEDLKEKAKLEETTEKTSDNTTDDSSIVGIPQFWLTALKQGPMLVDLIQPCDEPILAHLIDIKTIILESDPMGFVLEFHFSSNDYFSNSVLTKEYEMKCMPDPCDPFSFEGPEIVKCKGCKIDWKKGKNVTVKQVKKKQKHKNRSAVTRTVVKTVQNDSFFHFFSPPEIPEDSDSESYEETQNLLTNDFEVGHYIRERVVPNAVLFFTGEAVEDDFDDEEEEEEEEEEEDESDFEDGKKGTPNKNMKKKPVRGSFTAEEAKAALTGGKGPNPADCKQQ